MPDLQLGFPTKFDLKKEDLLKILKAAVEEKALSDSLPNLMERTGLGNKKVSPMKSWARRSGLVDKTNLTPEGQIVLDRDPFLKSPITEWLMHFHLSFGGNGLQPTPTNPADWGGWAWFVYGFLPNYFSFTLENLIYEARSVFADKTDAELKKGFSYVLNAYTKEQALAGCKFIQLVDQKKYAAGEAILPNPYLIGYFLAKLWERDYGQATSIVTDEVLHHPMGLTPVLGLEPTTLQTQIDKLEIFGLLEQRRTVPPFQIIRRWDNPLTLLEEAYAHA